MERTITGKIYPSRWDEHHKITRIIIDTTDEDQDEYHIENNKCGKELLDYIHHEVELTGTITENDRGDMVINVKNYEILGDSDGIE